MMSDLQLKAWHIENLIEHEPDAQVVLLVDAQSELERLRTELAELKAERDRLRQKILGHNQTCVNSCAFDCSEDMSGSCVDCPQSWMIKTDWAEEA